MLVVLDAAQSVGILRTNVDAMGADVLAVATQKALSGLYGVGFLYCRREVADELAPAAIGRYGVALPGEEDTEIPDAGLPYAAGARRFDLGNYNYIGAVAADAALGLLGRFGASAIEGHTVGIATELAEGLNRLGFPVAGETGGGRIGRRRSHIVVLDDAFHASAGAEHTRLDDFYRRLAALGVGCSVRKRRLRLSCGLWNSKSDVEQVLDAARAAVAQ